MDSAIVTSTTTTAVAMAPSSSWHVVAAMILLGLAFWQILHTASKGSATSFESEDTIALKEENDNEIKEEKERVTGKDILTTALQKKGDFIILYKKQHREAAKAFFFAPSNTGKLGSVVAKELIAEHPTWKQTYCSDLPPYLADLYLYNGIENYFYFCHHHNDNCTPKEGGFSGVQAPSPLFLCCMQDLHMRELELLVAKQANNVQSGPQIAVFEEHMDRKKAYVDRVTAKHGALSQRFLSFQAKYQHQMYRLCCCAIFVLMAICDYHVGRLILYVLFMEEFDMSALLVFAEGHKYRTFFIGVAMDVWLPVDLVLAAFDQVLVLAGYGGQLPQLATWGALVPFSLVLLLFGFATVLIVVGDWRPLLEGISGLFGFFGDTAAKVAKRDNDE